MKKARRSLLGHPVRAGAVAVLGLATAAMTGALATPAGASVQAAAPRFVTLAGSAQVPHAAVTGRHSSAQMSVEVALAPRNEAGLNRQLKAMYTQGSATYRHWLAKGRFDALYAPAAATRSAVRTYLTSRGLKAQHSPSPFLVRAAGSSQQVSAAFRTTLNNYRSARGTRFFANATAAQVPASLASSVQGVIGLSDAFRNRPDAVIVPSARKPATRSPVTAASSCQTSYPTEAQLAAYATSGTYFPFGYGGGPACSGLTPSQVNSLYGAPASAPAKEKGAGYTLAVVEYSAYQASDIDTWAHTFYGSSYSVPPLDNVNVDGGPLKPQCPSGDTCPADINGYDGDVEVDLDIQRDLTISPDISRVMVYNAANDYDGQTSLDDYTKIADDDTADAISMSWTVCEASYSTGFLQSENTIFEQMALQGQSFLAVSGDDGALGCEVDDGSTALAVDDPASQPYVTGVGGTSFEHYNPGTTASPAYPSSAESVWNGDGLCANSSTEEDGIAASQWCEQASWQSVGNAAGGGTSAVWGMPFYQKGPGVISSYTTYGNGTTNCALATAGTACREVPDVSADADTWTPYAEYCTATASMANSICGSSMLTKGETDPGWFGVAGTSSAGPLWAAVAADRDSYYGYRSGLLNPLLYELLATNQAKYFHDVTSAGQTVTSNGQFPATSGYDMATGIGTPKIAALITAPQLSLAGS